jgi:phage-related protein
MAFKQTNSYQNPYFYNRDFSVDSSYVYVNDLSKFKAVYGSSVSFSSRLNYMQTIDNSIKVIPASENNIVVKYNLIFLLNNQLTGELLKSIEAAQAHKFLVFKDPSRMYKDIIGYVEDYSVNKTSLNLNEVKISVVNTIKSPLFNWRTSSYLEDISVETTAFSPSLFYKKYDFIYLEDESTASLTTLNKQNKINNFWFARKDISPSQFNIADWSKSFIYETELPFELVNQIDVFKSDYKNSFVQNIKFKNNTNVLKSYDIKFTNIDDRTCRSILFFMEKKCGYRRFIYDFPIFLKKHKVFICTEWSHTFKYFNCHDLTLKFVEDPNPNILIDVVDTNNYNYYI